MKITPLLLAALTAFAAAPACAASHAAVDVLTAWLVQNKKEPLRQTDCRTGVSIGGIEFDVSCEETTSRETLGDKPVYRHVTIFTSRELGEDFSTLILRDDAAFSACLIYLPAVGDAALAKELKAASGAVVTGEQGAQLRAELLKRGAIVNAEEALSAAVAAQDKIKAADGRDRMLDRLKAWMPFGGR